MLIGHEVDIVGVLDGDGPGRREGKKLVDKLLGDSNRVIFVGDFNHAGNTTGETEDLFPDSYYLDAVRKAYGLIDLQFNADEEQIPNIIDRLTALFARQATVTLRSGESRWCSPTPSTPTPRRLLPRHSMPPRRSSGR